MAVTWKRLGQLVELETEAHGGVVGNAIAQGAGRRDEPVAGALYGLDRGFDVVEIAVEATDVQAVLRVIGW